MNRWIVITRDDRIRYNVLEKQAVTAARLRFSAGGADRFRSEVHQVKRGDCPYFPFT